MTAIVELAEKYDAMVMVDEAHATGMFGAGGAGVVQKLGLGNRVLVQMGTLGQSARRLRRLYRRQPRLVRFVDQPLPQFYFHDFAAAGGHGDGAWRPSIWCKSEPERRASAVAQLPKV